MKGFERVVIVDQHVDLGKTLYSVSQTLEARYYRDVGEALEYAEQLAQATGRIVVASCCEREQAAA